MADDQLAKSLSDLVTVIKAGLSMTTQSRFASNTFQPFQTSVTGTTAATIWTPLQGKRYVLRGFSCVAVVKEVLVTGATSANALFFKDGTGATIVTTICPYASNAAADTILRADCAPVLLDSGIPGSVVDSPLTIATGNSIGTGVIRFTGVVWGVEI